MQIAEALLSRAMTLRLRARSLLREAARCRDPAAFEARARRALVLLDRAQRLRRRAAVISTPSPKRMP